ARTGSPRHADDDFHRNDGRHHENNPTAERREIEQGNDAQRDRHDQDGGDNSERGLFHAVLLRGKSRVEIIYHRVQAQRMNPERWQQVEEVYHAARQRSPQERTVFLDGACRSDSDLRSKVESLLAGDGSGNGSPDGPTLTAVTAPSIPFGDPGALSAG